MLVSGSVVVRDTPPALSAGEQEGHLAAPSAGPGRFPAPEDPAKLQVLRIENENGQTPLDPEDCPRRHPLKQLRRPRAPGDSKERNFGTTTGLACTSAMGERSKAQVISVTPRLMGSEFCEIGEFLVSHVLFGLV